MWERPDARAPGGCFLILIGRRNRTRIAIELRHFPRCGRSPWRECFHHKYAYRYGECRDKSEYEPARTGDGRQSRDDGGQHRNHRGRRDILGDAGEPEAGQRRHDAGGRWRDGDRIAAGDSGAGHDDDCRQRAGNRGVRLDERRDGAGHRVDDAVSGQSRHRRQLGRSGTSVDHLRPVGAIGPGRSHDGRAELHHRAERSAVAGHVGEFEKSIARRGARRAAGLRWPTREPIPKAQPRSPSRADFSTPRSPI